MSASATQGGHNNRFSQKDTGRRRGHPSKLFKERSRLDNTKNTFSHGEVDTWNGLNGYIVNCKAVSIYG